MKPSRMLIDIENNWSLIEKLRLGINGEYITINNKKYIIADLTNDRINILEKSNISMNIFFDDGI